MVRALQYDRLQTSLSQSYPKILYFHIFIQKTNKHDKRKQHICKFGFLGKRCTLYSAQIYLKVMIRGALVQLFSFHKIWRCTCSRNYAVLGNCLKPFDLKMPNRSAFFCYFPKGNREAKVSSISSHFA